MDAAISCFRRRGFHQATMQEICAEADISAGALYRYFSSKAQIITAIAEDKHGEADLEFLNATRQHGVVDALSFIARGFFEKCAGGDGAVMADIYAETIRDPELAASLHKVAGHSLEYCVEAIKAAQKSDEVDPKLSPTQAANILFAAIEGIGLRRAFLHDADVDGAVADFRILAERFLSPAR